MNVQLKDIFFADEFIDLLAAVCQQAYPPFDKHEFLHLIYDDSWGDRALKDKMRHVSICLHAVLPADYPQALQILRQVAPDFHGFNAMMFPDYVSLYGLEHFDLSMEALKFFTPLCSSEYGVRPFLDEDPQRGMAYMLAWSEDEDEHVRRLSSEGCRPRLPWGMALKRFKKDPSPILPILENLKGDPSEYVRKSVANNLNDISKDHPEVVLGVCERWYGASKEVDRVVKHGCRGLLKQGDPRALLLFGFSDPALLDVADLALERDTLAIGETLHYTFDLLVSGDQTCKVRLELGVDYVKARGKTSRKIFQLGEAHYQPGKHTIQRKLSFEERTTRKHYPGAHVLNIIVNGEEKASASVELTSKT